LEAPAPGMVAAMAVAPGPRSVRPGQLAAECADTGRQVCPQPGLVRSGTAPCGQASPQVGGRPARPQWGRSASDVGATARDQAHSSSFAPPPAAQPALNPSQTRNDSFIPPMRLREAKVLSLGPSEKPHGKGLHAHAAQAAPQPATARARLPARCAAEQRSPLRQRPADDVAGGSAAPSTRPGPTVPDAGVGSGAGGYQAEDLLCAGAVRPHASPFHRSGASPLQCAASPVARQRDPAPAMHPHLGGSVEANLGPPDPSSQFQVAEIKMVRAPSDSDAEALLQARKSALGAHWLAGGMAANHENAYLKKNIEHLRQGKRHLESQVAELEERLKFLATQNQQYKMLYEQSTMPLMRGDSGEMEISSLHQQLSAVQMLKDALNKENLELHIKLEAAQKAERNELKHTACVICIDNLANVVCLPCKHLALCSFCGQQNIGNCPICRSEITEQMQIFVP